MRYFVLLLILLHVSINAQTLQQLVSDFKLKKYSTVCQDGLGEYRAGHYDEKLLALTGTACSYVDNINPLGSFQAKMISTPESRATSAYFTSLLLEKKLIYHFMLDNISLSNLSLPKSPHILSFVFEHLASGKFQIISQNPKVIKIEDADKSALVSLSNDALTRVIIEERSEASTKRHIFQ